MPVIAIVFVVAVVATGIFMVAFYEAKRRNRLKAAWRDNYVAYGTVRWESSNFPASRISMKLVRYEDLQTFQRLETALTTCSGYFEVIAEPASGDHTLSLFLHRPGHPPRPVSSEYTINAPPNQPAPFDPLILTPAESDTPGMNAATRLQGKFDLGLGPSHSRPLIFRVGDESYSIEEADGWDAEFRGLLGDEVVVWGRTSLTASGAALLDVLRWRLADPAYIVGTVRMLDADTASFRLELPGLESIRLADADGTPITPGSKRAENLAESHLNKIAATGTLGEDDLGCVLQLRTWSRIYAERRQPL